jgi:hypothetical protein
MRKNCCRITTSDNVFRCISRVVYRSPKAGFRKILSELEDYGLIKLIAKNQIEIVINSQIEKKINELKDHIFPFSPNI